MDALPAAIVAVAVSLVVATASCTSRTVSVGVAFENDWQLGKETLTPQEQYIVKRTALQTLQQPTSISSEQNTGLTAH